jgi:hypothetical protein
MQAWALRRLEPDGSNMVVVIWCFLAALDGVNGSTRCNLWVASIEQVDLLSQ